MLWEDKQNQPYVVPDDIADLVFKIDCRQIALDHAYDLLQALMSVLPWLVDEDKAAVHMIHGASTGNGWQRPEADNGEGFIYLSHRSKMHFRLPKERYEDVKALIGQTINVGGNNITFGEYQLKPLTSTGTLFSRYIILQDNESEEAFIQRVVAEMKSIGVQARKVLCGMGGEFIFPAGKVHTASLMVADLDPEEAVILQQLGIGEGRKMGFGLFIPHKGIKPVGDMSEQSHFSGTE
jgi:CRISPR-associated protein Cas6